MIYSVPSIIKAHFSWTWQCTTLNRGDELINLLLSCIQQYQLCVPEHMTISGRWPGLGHYLFGILSLYHETKVPKPGVVLNPSYAYTSEAYIENFPEAWARLQLCPPTLQSPSIMLNWGSCFAPPLCIWPRRPLWQVFWMGLVLSIFLVTGSVILSLCLCSTFTASL